ncbi:hypothetical protein [Pseudomonas sp.]|uniref:hypothetical protein n=1 Tax=Pseudomonas sp. TaxID=306 RepID=UPI00290E2D20|nr:hypothetical protein [Pseudomonas sp.]MDU4254577.1 hypothetical protein [Pseudomonas sp.]
MKDDIYRGVDRTEPPSHPHLKPGWVRPAPPAGFVDLVALLAPVKVDGKDRYMWFLDYLDTERNVFASDDQEVEVPWPWVAGFVPQMGDWDAIGIPHLT